MPITGELTHGDIDSPENGDSYVNGCSGDGLEMNGLKISPKRSVSEPNNATVSSNHFASSNGVQPKPKATIDQALPGETLIRYEEKNDYRNGNVLEDGQIYVSMFRFVITVKNNQGLAVVPLCSLDNVETKDEVYLQLNIKDGRIIRLKASSREAALELYKKLTCISTAKRSLKDIFATTFHENNSKNSQLKWIRTSDDSSDINSSKHPVQREFKHCGFDRSKWRISGANSNFEVCESYPDYIIVPRVVSDDEVRQLSPGRFMSRFPACVFRDRISGGLLFRSSQPKITWLGTVSQADIAHLEKIAHVNDDEPLLNGGSANGSVNGSKRSGNGKMLILDMRSYTAAWANRAKGGGFESSDTYPSTEIEFMALGNIHNMRYSFCQLRNVVNTPGDPSLPVTLHSTQWYQFIVAILRVAVRCQEAVQSGRTVLVHCSDGWDRTTQIVSLCKLLVDPYYRTFEGFKHLVQREWVDFGHKFADRHGVFNEDPNEVAPIFLQWLDCVYQLWSQNKTAFEFNRRYLMKLAQHSHCGMFGTFLFNNMKQAKASSMKYEADVDNCSMDDFSTVQSLPSMYTVWDYLGRHNAEFHNVFYHVDYPISTLKCGYDYLDIDLWRDVYKCSDVETATNPLVVEKRSNEALLVRSHSTTSLNDHHNTHPLPNGSHASHTSLARKYTAKKVDLLSFMDQDGLIRVPLDEDVYQLLRAKNQHESESPLDASPILHSTPMKTSICSTAPENVPYPKNCNGRPSDSGGSPCSNGEITVK